MNGDKNEIEPTMGASGGESAGEGAAPLPDLGALRHLLATRRSTRRFLPDEVPEETLRGLLDAARYTPSGGNRRAHELTVMPLGAGRETLLVELTKIYARRSALLNSTFAKIVARPFVGPYLRAFLDDQEYGGRIAELLAKLGRGEDPIFYNAPLVVLFHSKVLIPTPKEDCILSAYALALAAHAFGLGSCFVTLAQNAVNSSKACKAMLGMRPEDQVHAVLLLGRAETRNLEPVSRPPLAVRMLRSQPSVSA